MNVSVFIGRITADPELTKKGQHPYLSFSLAVRRDYKDKAEEYQTDFVNCCAWRQKAEYIAKYFKKGDLVAVQTSYRTYPYTDKDNNKRTFSVFKVENIQLLKHPKADQVEAETERVPTPPADLKPPEFDFDLSDEIEELEN